MGEVGTLAHSPLKLSGRGSTTAGESEMADIKVSPPPEPDHDDTPPPPPPPRRPSSGWTATTTAADNLALAPGSTAASEGLRSRSTSSSQSSNRADSLGSSGLWDDATGSSSTSPDSEYAPKPVPRRTSLTRLGESPEGYWPPPKLPMRTATPDPRATPLASSAGFAPDDAGLRAATYPPHQTAPRELGLGPPLLPPRSPPRRADLNRGKERPRSPPASSTDAPSWPPRLPSPQPWQADNRSPDAPRRRSSGILKHLPPRRRAPHDDDDTTSPNAADLLGHLEDFGVHVVEGAAAGHSIDPASRTTTIEGRPPPLRPAAPPLPREHSSRPSLVSPTASRNLSNQLLNRSSDGDKSPAETIRAPGPRFEVVSPAQLGRMIAASRTVTATPDGKSQEREAANRKLLVIDARKLDDYLGQPGRLLGSVNVNFPSLLIKRFRRKTCLANFRLDSFITTELGKDHLHALAGSEGSLSSLDICVVDDELSVKNVVDPPASAGTGIVLLGVLDHLAREQAWSGRLYLLEGRFDDLDHDAESVQWLTRGEAADEHSAPSASSSSAPQFTAVVHSSPTTAEEPPARKHGLLRLRPSGNLHHDLPRPDGEGGGPPRSPFRHDSGASEGSYASTASSPAYLDGGSGDAPSRQGSLGGSNKTKQKLRRIDTSDSLLGSGSRPVPKRAPTPLSIPSSAGEATTTTPPSSRLSIQEMCRSQARVRISPGGNFDPPPGTTSSSSPQTPDSSTSASLNGAGASGSASSSQFIVSTVIPGFLYLGGEPKKPADYKELEAFGVQRILNVAIECTEEEEECRRRFKAWDSISLYDNVEEAGVQSAIERCNTLLDDASLHSAPTFLHCVAGKSRSVTIAIAYLMHRRGWSLQQAYGHVSDCRRGVSPNIGFVAELLRFEEKAKSRPNPRREDSRDAGGPRPTHRSLADPGRTQSLGSFNAVLMSVARSHHQRRDSTPLARSSSSSSAGTTSLAGLMDRRRSEGSPAASPMSAL